ncbi:MULTISPECIES: efflux RND transporter periplasmic adaptor subunit [Pseudoalteromonas]|uniref:Efflux RND transporter periplasmic adaptor subunit n=1 Tax=Pseudoalteromonas rubra TaxID=43658 RepID=A0A5S3UQD4_9GAMM|nr:MULTISPECIES: efflux RND transporter periplasmic adaptor subunit [Pseudoalteromonas]MCG7562461.1 efflux RND transporter periplasmic adaptor subunit [Pseudoalteromonas sp. McH1-42]QPB83677.1 efflux RND transporter periplasmic adaptor subunit [Pseudoalteromonas rubra]
MNKISYTLSAVALALVLSGCSQPSAQEGQQPPPLTIDVAQVKMAPVQSWHTFTTRLQAPERVVLKPRVSGQVEQMTFKEGERIEKGQILFRLDPRPFEVQVETLNAQLVSADAALMQAKSEARRAKQLVAEKAMSTELAEQRAATLRQAQANRDAIAAQLKKARLDLEFSQVEAPISGVVSRAIVTKGNYVSAGETTLATIVSDQQIYAYFDVDERTWSDKFAGVDATDAVTVQLQRINGGASVPGVVDFIDNEINPNTGTLGVRAVFDAQQHGLKPGAFARISLGAADATTMPLVPERAIGTDLKNRFVLTVDANNTLQYRLVELGERYGAFRAIKSGLEDGDKVAANGPARVGPGMPITPNMVTLNLDDTRLVIAQRDIQLSAAN